MVIPIQQVGMIHESTSKGPWVCPIIRCRRELGIHMNWNDEGCYLYGGELQSPIEAELINVLPYIGREQFEDIRLALAASHRLGRIPARGYKEHQRSIGELSSSVHCSDTSTGS